MKTTVFSVFVQGSLLAAGLIALVMLGGCDKKTDQAVADKGAASGPPADLYRTTDIPSTGDKDLKFNIQGREKAVVLQNAETDLDLTIIRHSEYVVASASLGGVEAPTSFLLAGSFQGEVKLAAEIAKGGKGLTVKFDPETVKGSDDKAKLRINADAEADLGDVDVKLTATTPEGKTASVTLTIEVYKK
jgi:hypothetical protein